MSEKSKFQIAFDNFQEEITKSLFELAASSDYFRECSTFPLPGAPPSNESTGKAKIKKTKKETNEDEITKPEKPAKAEKASKVDNKEESDQKKDAKDNQEKVWTVEEIDKDIIASSKRTKNDVKSKGFIKNLKKRMKNVENSLINERIDALLEEGKIVNNPKEE